MTVGWTDEVGFDFVKQETTVYFQDRIRALCLYTIALAGSAKV